MLDVEAVRNGGTVAQLDPAAAEEELSEEKLCVICLVNRRDTTVLPCRHLCMCQDCAQACPRPASESRAHVCLNVSVLVLAVPGATDGLHACGTPMCSHYYFLVWLAGVLCLQSAHVLVSGTVA